MKTKLLICTACIAVMLFIITGCNNKEVRKEKKVGFIKNFEDKTYIKKQIGKLAPVEIRYTDQGLTENQKKGLRLIVKAAKYMDEIFLRQVYVNNTAIRKELKNLKKSSEAAEYFKINFGPFDRLNKNRAFINKGTEKPKGANFYPADMSKEEFNKTIETAPELKKDFCSELTVIRREEKSGKLKAVPYSEEYREFLVPAADMLKKAAGFIENTSLKKYLYSVAESFIKNDYFTSDMNWVDLKDHSIEVVIGPYEVYEDEMFNFKAAFEAFITIVDKEESKKLAKIENLVTDMEKHLPIEDKYKNFSRGKSSPIVIVNEIFTAGDTKSGIQTTAFNLPNNEKVREAKGSKKVMLKNIAHAKFDKCWIPIVNEILDAEDLKLVSFDAYFNHVLMHEISHGLGPGNISINGRNTSVSSELKELYSVIEEAKADTLGIWNLKFMIDKNIFPKDLEKHIYISYLGGMFRSIRFGINQAHGGANAIQLNYILAHEGFKYNKETKKFSVNHSKILEAVKSLSTEILMLQAKGDYNGAKAFINKYRVLTPELKEALTRVKHVPVDIRPVYQIEKELEIK